MWHGAWIGARARAGVFRRRVGTMKSTLLIYQRGYLAARDGATEVSLPDSRQVNYGTLHRAKMRGVRDGLHVFTLEQKHRQKTGRMPVDEIDRIRQGLDPKSPCWPCGDAAVCGLFELSCSHFNAWVTERPSPVTIKMPSRRLYLRLINT
mgnify:FL=1